MAALEPSPEINQRDLRQRSREIMDAVEQGHSFTVTRDGRGIGQLVPLRSRRRFVPRADFFGSPGLEIDLEAFRADQDAVLDDEVDDPYAR